MKNDINLPGFTAEVTIFKSNLYNRLQVSTYSSLRSQEVVMQMSMDYLRCIANNCQGSFASETCYDLCDFANSEGEDGGSGDLNGTTLWKLYCHRRCSLISHSRQSLIECLGNCRD